LIINEFDSFFPLQTILTRIKLLFWKSTLYSSICRFYLKGAVQKGGRHSEAHINTFNL